MSDAQLAVTKQRDDAEEPDGAPYAEAPCSVSAAAPNAAQYGIDRVHGELERLGALLEAQAGMLSVDQVRMLMSAKDDMIASRDAHIADLKSQLDARNRAETELRQILTTEQIEKQRLLQAQLFHQAETELRHLAATDAVVHPAEPSAAQKLKKRLVEIGMAIGILMLSWPHVTNTYAQLQQWAIDRSASSTPQAPSKESQGMFAGSANPPKSASAAADTTPEASYAEAVHSLRLTIPRLHLDKPVVEGVGDSDLAKSVGHYPDTALPGEVGNCVLAGHLNMWGREFAHLDQLAPGDTAQVTSLGRAYTYRVTGMNKVSPSDTSSLEPHASQQELTLVTCTPGARQRIVVHAVLQSDQPTSMASNRRTSRR